MLKRKASSAAPDDAATSTASSIAVCIHGPGAPRGGGRPATPAAAKATGSATARTNSRTLCTMAIARTFAPGVLGERHRLCQRAGRRGKQRIERRPAMHVFQVRHHGERDPDHGEHERDHGQRPGDHGGDRRRRHRRAERYPKQDINDPRDRCRDEHRSAGERRRRHADDCAREPSGRQAGQAERRAADARDQQGFGEPQVLGARGSR